MTTTNVFAILNPAQWYPAAFVATYVLLAFSATPNPVSALWRPLIVGAALAVALQLLAWLITRHRERAALITAVVVLALLATWVPLMVVAAGGSWLLLMRWLRRRDERTHPHSVAQATPLIAAFAWALAAIAVVPVVAFAAANMAPAAAPSGERTIEQSGEDVVIILLDGYPRADSQREQFAIEPGEFERDLAERGFDVAASSRSNYTSTWMTLVSMLHGRYVHEIDGLSQVPEDPAEQYRRLMAAIRSGPLLEDLRRSGYEIVTVPPPYESATITGSDRILSPPQLTSFELSLLQHSLGGRALLSAAPRLAYDQHRERIESSIEILVREAAARAERPRIILAHLLAPHAPVVYGPEGSPAEPAACFPECAMYVMHGDADWARYADHLASVNQVILDAVDAVRTASDDATIVLMSDHGSVRTGADPANGFRSFFAARVPDGRTSFPNDVSPVDVLRLIASPDVAPTAPYNAWVSEPEEPMSVTPFDVTRP